MEIKTVIEFSYYTYSIHLYQFFIFWHLLYLELLSMHCCKRLYVLRKSRTNIKVAWWRTALSRKYENYVTTTSYNQTLFLCLGNLRVKTCQKFQD